MTRCHNISFSFFYPEEKWDRLGLFISAFGAYTVFVESNAAQRTAVNLILGGKLCTGSIHTAGKGNLCNV